MLQIRHVVSRMEFEDFGARFVVAVEDISGNWSSLADVGILICRCCRLTALAQSIEPTDTLACALQALTARLPLRNITLRNKFGNAVAIPELSIQ